MPIFQGSFKDKAVKKFYFKGIKEKLPVENTDKLQDILDYIDGITELPPSLMLYRAHEH